MIALDTRRPPQPAPPGERLRILFIAPYVPSAIRVRSRELIRALVERGHAVSLVCLAGPGDEEDLAWLRRICARVTPVPARRADSLRAYLGALPTGLPLQAAHCLGAAFVGATREAISRGGYDLIHVEHLRAAEVARVALSGVPEPPPVVLDAVDCISLLFERTVRRNPSPAPRAVALLDLARTRRYEATYGDRFARVTVTSPEDRWALEVLREGLGAAGGAPVSVVPNGVDGERFRPDPAEREPATVLFSGKMSYHANEAAAMALVRAIMPLVWRSRPDARVVIAGADPSPRLRAMGRDPRVEVTGTVPDLRPYLARATVAVAPIVYGVGVQNKVLEALAMGTPVVAARQATVALAARPGADLLVADDAPGFARQILALLDDPARAASLGAAGRAYVERHHSWDASAAALEACYTQALTRCK